VQELRQRLKTLKNYTHMEPSTTALLEDISREINSLCDTYTKHSFLCFYWDNGGLDERDVKAALTE
jgi:hypothetical protein